MGRFALFAAAVIILVAIGTQPTAGGSSINSVCVCVPARAGLIMKSAITRVQARSTELFAVKASVTQ
jgi:hypothetical protein